MKAIVVREYGGPEKLSYEEETDPTINESQVLVRIRACSVNRRDVLTRIGQGLKIPLPFIPGGDLAGEVVSVGTSVEKFRVGDRVIAYPRLPCGKCKPCLSKQEDLCAHSSIMLGAYAEMISLPEVTLLPIPPNMSYDIGASIPIDFITAWNLLVTIGKLDIGDTVLVYAGGSGLGTSAISICKQRGAEVITTVGEEWKIDRAQAAGADHVINRKKEKIAESIMRITSGNGVDLVLDHVGAPTWQESLRSLREGGKMLVCGTTGGNQASIDIRQFYSKKLSIHGGLLGPREDLVTVVKLFEEGKLSSVIDSLFKLEDAAQAHSKMEHSEHFGKIILKPR